MFWPFQKLGFSWEEVFKRLFSKEINSSFKVMISFDLRNRHNLDLLRCYWNFAWAHSEPTAMLKPLMGKLSKVSQVASEGMDRVCFSSFISYHLERLVEAFKLSTPRWPHLMLCLFKGKLVYVSKLLYHWTFSGNGGTKLVRIMPIYPTKTESSFLKKEISSLVEVEVYIETAFLPLGKNFIRR